MFGATCVLYKSQGLSVKMYGFNSKIVCKNYEQSITNEGVGYSQRGGFVKTVYIVMKDPPPGAYHNGKPVVNHPPGRTPTEGLMKPLHRHNMIV